MEILSECSVVLVTVVLPLLDDGEALFCFGWIWIGVSGPQVEPIFWAFDGSPKAV